MTPTYVITKELKGEVETLLQTTDFMEALKFWTNITQFACCYMDEGVPCLYATESTLEYWDVDTDEQFYTNYELATLFTE